MALRLNKILAGHITAPQCYAKLAGVTFYPPKSPNENINSLQVDVAFYFDNQSRELDIWNYVEIRTYWNTSQTCDSRPELYSWLKTLDDFEGAQDIIDTDFHGDAYLII